MSDPLALVFLICFLVATVLTLVSLTAGVAHVSLPGGHALHLGHIAHGHAGSQGGENASPLNFGSLLAFLAWFGGVGYLLRTASPLTLVLVLLFALLAGLGGATLLALFLFKVLLPAQTAMDPERYRLDGTPGRITAAIVNGGTGEITYSKAGARRSDAARSIDGQPIPRDAEVVILKYYRGIAYVETIDRYLKSPAKEIAERIEAIGSNRQD